MAEMTRPELRVELDFFCGCGDPEAAADALLDILNLHPMYEHWAEFDAMVPNSAGLRWLLLYLLDEAGQRKGYHDCWFEHGGNIGGQWLAPKGEAVRAALRREKDADNFEGLFPDNGHCVHGFAENDEGYEAHDCMAVERAERESNG